MISFFFFFPLFSLHFSSKAILSPHHFVSGEPTTLFVVGSGKKEHWRSESFWTTRELAVSSHMHGVHTGCPSGKLFLRIGDRESVVSEFPSLHWEWRPGLEVESFGTLSTRREA
ncbi:hypothetical protein K432DRAFT_206833 [Lepidopterella palustris CBS 459.81]|uniref:Secreted protein n=1 Tax=Lepidopterella palustris CBS 459.81 TaxID=1314670 RepID=A0A8E2EFE9_9PEZI|nr:hypothetical protein K432DRAFT_206833 [Lepidopterella palustris CBS 459.81]